MIKTIGKFAKSIVTAGVPVAGKALKEVVQNAVPGGDIGLDATKIILGTVFRKKPDEAMADHIPFEAVLKLELADHQKRTFAAYRMCWVGGNKPDWLFLDEGTLPTLLKEYVRHIGKESFYDLV